MKILRKILTGFLILLVFSACERDPKKTGFEIFPDMARSVPYDSFAPNPNTPRGQTLVSPVPGTIPRGFMPFPYPATPEGALAAGQELKNPIPYSTESLERGKVLYGNFCLICHGETGQGDGPLIPKYPNPPTFTSKNVRNYPPGRLYHIITLGSGQMASYGSQIRPQDRWKLVYYIQQLQGKKPGEPEPETQPMEVKENIKISGDNPKKDPTDEN